ncbi:MAG TPA: efflux RND transporter periplasmic adaptor subunit [Chthoniobacterales bacterium]|jgi:RND family efflux transporter MFP subunit
MATETETKRHAPPRRHPPVRTVAIWGPIAVVAALSLFLVLGIWRHVHERHEEQSFAKQNSQVTVEVAKVKRDTKPQQLVLPGNMLAYEETTIYPRSNGYVAKWIVDIGDDVKQGDLLAIIETPEVDQQLAQARANYQLADQTAQRWTELAAKKVVSDQDRDEKVTAKRTAQAALEQLEKTQGFNKIIAPFAGKITARDVDVGALVSPTTPLFSIAQSDPLRVYVYVPQSNAPSIHEGEKAKVSVQEFPGTDFDGVVTRTAGALDPASRAMQVEVQVPNHEGKLFSGMYGEVRFQLVDKNAPLTVPANAFLFRTEGPEVATVTDEKKIHWARIKVGRDFGTEMEVLDGLKENSLVVVNPTDQLQDGLKVQIKPAPKPKGETPDSGAKKDNAGAK